MILGLLAALVAGGLVYFAAGAWCSLMERLADSGKCTCLKGRWDPKCPRHGRREPEEPFPGANPW